MECRVSAEDPENQFFPSPGKIVHLREPAGPNVRVDSGVYAGWTVPVEYDSLLAKLIAWGPDRNAAIERLLRALQEYSISGIETNLQFFSQLLGDAGFRDGELHTAFIADFFARRSAPAEPADEIRMAVALAAAAHAADGQQPNRSEKDAVSHWLAAGRDQLLR